MDESKLFKTSLQDRIDVVSVFLENRAAIDQKGSNDATALFVACTNRHLDVFQLLIKHGAPIDVENSTGVDPVAIARANGNINVASSAGFLNGNRDSSLTEPLQGLQQVGSGCVAAQDFISRIHTGMLELQLS
ncbi:Ankyrin-3 [Phytophthora citrophthora]|uniref:Ankyrin-3 n=1 Tax=Phytophthora citrophthora TaxID=4793 RepID=A0AAD9LMK7_9STRA|nr:Ankyrin-3 [Phytophthora citrophthora]KAK1942747.1 Ankyrin-3 [Phytophthora citrophthora]